MGYSSSHTGCFDSCLRGLDALCQGCIPARCYTSAAITNAAGERSQAPHQLGGAYRGVLVYTPSLPVPSSDRATVLAPKRAR